MVTDPVGDFIIRLKNAAMVGKRDVSVPYSRLKESIALALKKAGYLTAVEEAKSQRELSVVIAYGTDGAAAIRGVKRISKPGRRLYAGVAAIHPVRYGKGMLILSTPKGILSDAEARKI